MTATPDSIEMAFVKVTCPAQPSRVTYAAVRAGDLGRIVAASRDDLIIAACEIELPDTVLATATAFLAVERTSECIVGSTIDGIFIDGFLRGQAVKVGPEPAPVTCPWCHQTMASDAYSAHLVKLAEAPHGFVCMPPEGSAA